MVKSWKTVKPIETASSSQSREQKICPGEIQGDIGESEQRAEDLPRGDTGRCRGERAAGRRRRAANANPGPDPDPDPHPDPDANPGLSRGCTWKMASGERSCST